VPEELSPMAQVLLGRDVPLYWIPVENLVD
jgi:hypothetical protein